MIEHVEVLPDADALSRRAADVVSDRIRASGRRSARFSFAVSGGRTPWAMFEHLRAEDVDWSQVDLYQVDERIAPDGDPDRNLTQLAASLPPGVRVHAMPVDDDAPDAAAARYASTLPERFDLVHLGLGPDGHTASLIPGDDVLDVTDRDVALTGEYQGRRRMTLTYPALDRAVEVLWLVAGADKVDALRKLRAEDLSIPAGRVTTERQLLLVDRAACPAG